MLNIPDSVKQLYMMDGIRKNFRVTFPDGELPDITNGQVVDESVKFTESIMSQSKFRFGLAESPQISFECVGVANMLGMQIQCWHEIDLSSLSAADIAAIEAGTWDGVYVPLADSDTGYAYFRIPLGIFTVESCPRSHGAMNHRRVEATGRTISNDSLDSFTRWKLTKQYPSKNWTVNWDFLSPSLYGGTWARMSEYFTGTEIAAQGTADIAQTNNFRINFSTGILSYIAPYSSPGYYCKTLTSIDPTLLRISRTGYSHDKLAAAVRANLDETFSDIESNYTVRWNATTDADGNTLGSRDACLDYAVESILVPKDIEDLGPSMGWAFQPYIRVADILMNIDDSEANHRYFMPSYFGNIDSVIDMSFPEGAEWVLYLPYKIRAFQLSARSTQDVTTRHDVAESIPAGAASAFYTLAIKPEYDLDFPERQLPTTLNTKFGGVKYYGYFNSFSFADIVSGFFECKGMFARLTRDGGLEPYTLTPTPVMTITPSDIRELWWDESDVLPIGQVKVRYKDASSSEETDVVVEIDRGPSVYDMSTNKYLTKWGIAFSEVVSILSGLFKTNAAALTWTPTESTIRGLPFLEAGDWIRIQTGATDVPYVSFPMLDRQMDGVQMLADAITAPSGDIVEVEVDNG